MVQDGPGIVALVEVFFPSSSGGLGLLEVIHKVIQPPIWGGSSLAFFVAPCSEKVLKRNTLTMGLFLMSPNMLCPRPPPGDLSKDRLQTE